MIPPATADEPTVNRRRREIIPFPPKLAEAHASALLSGQDIAVRTRRIKPGPYGGLPHGHSDRPIGKPPTPRRGYTDRHGPPAPAGGAEGSLCHRQLV